MSPQYSFRSAAVRAARNAAKRALGPQYEAHEGPDYIIHVLGPYFSECFSFELRGPALNPNDEEREIAARSWAHYRERKNAVSHIATGVTS